METLESLEAKQQLLDEEFQAGELTDFGYRKRKLALQKSILEKELNEGELTEQGFAKKMARLEKTVIPAKPAAATRASPPGPSGVKDKESAKDISTELARSDMNEKVREKIQGLFGRKKAKLPTLPKADLKAVKGVKFHRKEITVVCVDKQTFAVPTRKQRDFLVKEGKVRETFLGKSESESDVLKKLALLFPDYVLTFLKVTGSKDLIPADMSACSSVMDIVDGINLYVRGEKKPSDPPKEPPKSTPTTSTQIVNSIISGACIVSGSTTHGQLGHSETQTSQSGAKHSVCAQVVNTSHQFDQNSLIREVHDDDLFTFLGDHSELYQPTEKPPVDDEVLQYVIANRNTLLHKDSAVIQWLDWLRKGKRTVETPAEHREYVIVNLEQMNDFYAYKKSHCTFGFVELPARALLEYYSQSQKKNFPVLIKYDNKYIMMSPKDVDDLIVWIMEVRRNPNYVFEV